MQNEVSIHLKREILEKILLFKGISVTFLRAVSLHMLPIVSIPGESILLQVIRGKFEVILNDEVISILKDNDFFGEIVLFAEEKKELQLLRVLCTAIFTG